MIESIDETFYRIVNNDWITINEKKLKGLRFFFNTEKLTRVPESVSPIHGDLTLENILYNPISDDIKVIDQSGARYVDPYEFDVAKLLQSLLAKYSEWDTFDFLCRCDEGGQFYVNEKMLDLDETKYRFMLKEFEEDTKHVFKKGLFFLATYLIRMIPFLLKKSKVHATTGLLLALYYLKEVSSSS
jgi:thiamine kinase-like enzyme